MKRKYFNQVPETIKRRTYYNQYHYCMGLYDAFDEAVRNELHNVDNSLYDAWMNGDYRNYIPQCYYPEYLTTEQRFFVENNCIK